MIDDIDTVLREHSVRVQAELAEQDAAWGTSGWTRRRFLAGAGMVGVAALGSQLVTSRAAFAATPTASDNTLIVIFMRGAADGLRILQPMTSALGFDQLQHARGALSLGTNQAIALTGSSAGWGLNPALAPIAPLLTTGELAFVPAVSNPDLTRSHFTSQMLLERGGVPTASDGWLNRALAQMGAGTTFRAVAEGGVLPMSLLGAQTALGLTSIANFKFPGWTQILASSQTAVSALYRGVSGVPGRDVPIAMDALATAAAVRTDPGPQNGATYPTGDLATAFKDLAAMLRTEVGLQVATVDVGGWDTHTDEVTDLDRNLAAFATTLNAFMTDLGPARRSRVTVAVMTEFGRRVQMNGSGGTDHGHGSVMWLLGGGLAGSGVYGKWNGLTDAVLDQGDVPGLNSPFDVLGEIAQARLGVSNLSAVFPGHSYSPLGVAAASTP